MYARDVAGETLNLGVSGLLWQNSLVMIDDETESLWSHLLGEAMKGPLEGKTLEVIPSVISDWRAWKQSYPKATAVMMLRTADRYRSDLHRVDPRLLFGLVQDGEAKGWDFRFLMENLVHNDRVGKQEVLLVYHEPSGTPVVYSRAVDGQILNFDFVDGKVIDRETKTEWDILTGRATSSPTEAKRLTQLPGIVSDHHAWHIFHPETGLVLPGFPEVAPSSASLPE